MKQNDGEYSNGWGSNGNDKNAKNPASYTNGDNRYWEQMFCQRIKLFKDVCAKFMHGATFIMSPLWYQSSLFKRYSKGKTFPTLLLSLEK